MGMTDEGAEVRCCDHRQLTFVFTSDQGCGERGAATGHLRFVVAAQDPQGVWERNRRVALHACEHRVETLLGPRWVERVEAVGADGRKAIVHCAERLVEDPAKGFIEGCVRAGLLRLRANIKQRVELVRPNARRGSGRIEAVEIAERAHRVRVPARNSLEPEEVVQVGPAVRIAVSGDHRFGEGAHGIARLGAIGGQGKCKLLGGRRRRPKTEDHCQSGEPALHAAIRLRGRINDSIACTLPA